MAQEHILIVDDEEDILELVRYNLTKDGLRVRCVNSGEACLDAVKSERPDLILLDLMLPGMNGYDVCRVLKRGDSAGIPVVMLTAKGEEADIVTGLELGADDYITKPFSPRLLLARVRAVLRRNARNPEEIGEVLSLQGVFINPGKHEVKVDEQLVELTSTEFKILYFLAKRRGWVFTRDQIVKAVHGHDYPVTDRSIDVQIVGLRKKLLDYGSQIETIRGVGYRYKELG